MIKLSVIVLVHNNQQYLAECLTSIRAQPFKDYELIVIDDCSTENVSDIVSPFNPDKFVRLDVHKGTVSASNYGVWLSSGKLICRIDADDWIESNYFSSCVAALDADSRVAIAYTDFWHFGNGKDNGVIFPEYSLIRLQAYNFILGSAIYRRSAFDEVNGYAEEFADGMEDYDVWLSICERGHKAKHVSGYLYHYRSHDTNRSNHLDYPTLFDKIRKKHPIKVEVTAEICTRDRYFTTLPLAINSVIQQTYKVKKLIIYDDGKHEDLRNVPLYHGLFRMIDEKGIAWEVVFTPGHGQTINHNLAYKNAPTDWVWRLDDDNVAEPDTLAKLVSCIEPGVGAVGGLVLDPKVMNPLPALASSKMEDIYLGINPQWFRQTGTKEVDHLYSTFLYNREAAPDGYCTELSMVGHREETIFSYSIKRNGFKLVMNSGAITWHLREPSGGIRTQTQSALWEHDEAIFKRKLFEWGIKPREVKVLVLNSGLGDHLCFSNIVPELKVKYTDKRLVLAVCYPEVFKDSDIEVISIAEAEMTVGKQACDDQSVYKWCWDRDWKGSLLDAYRGLYL